MTAFTRLPSPRGRRLSHRFTGSITLTKNNHLISIEKRRPSKSRQIVLSAIAAAPTTGHTQNSGARFCSCFSSHRSAHRALSPLPSSRPSNGTSPASFHPHPELLTTLSLSLRLWLNPARANFACRRHRSLRQSQSQSHSPSFSLSLFLFRRLPTIPFLFANST